MPFRVLPRCVLPYRFVEKPEVKTFFVSLSFVELFCCYIFSALHLHKLRNSIILWKNKQFKQTKRGQISLSPMYSKSLYYKALYYFLK